MNRGKIIKTITEMGSLLRSTDDATVVLRDKGGYVWVSSGYTREGIFLTLHQNPLEAGSPLSIQVSKRLMDYGPFTVVFDTRDEEDGTPQAPELVTDPHDLSSYPWNQRATWSTELRERIATKYDQARELLCEQQHPGLDFGAAALVVADLTARAEELRTK